MPVYFVEIRDPSPRPQTLSAKSRVAPLEPCGEVGELEKEGEDVDDGGVL